MKKRYIFIPIILVALLTGVAVADRFLHFLPRKTYSGEDFDIPHYFSSVDQDGDGIDDQSDIYAATLSYLATKPKYKSKYYAEGGYPNDEYGVCTDVVAFALRDAGYDLQELVDADIAAAPDAYESIEKADKNIDFRRVRNLAVYFKRHHIALSTDINDIAQWQAGDVVIFPKHIGIVSQKRDKKGRPYLLHLANPMQVTYEAPLSAYEGTITAHYRVS